METDRNVGIERREFLKRAGLAGAVVWAAPVVQTVAAGPAFAQTNGTPVFCGHSVGAVFRGGEQVGDGGCMEAAIADCQAEELLLQQQDNCANVAQPHARLCCFACRPGQGGDNPCCNPGLCDIDNFTCEGAGQTRVVCYTGPTAGCEDIGRDLLVCFTHQGGAEN